MKLINWNIQWCRGMDGRVDPARIAAVARELCDPDVCCFQEVADNYDSLAGSAGENQFDLLSNRFEDYSAHVAWAVDVPDAKGGRRRFGNLILSRLPVHQVFRHSLPWPPENGVPNMPRVAIEAVIRAPWGMVSVTTTHLEYYSARQRAAQVGRLRELRSEALLHSKSERIGAGKTGPFERFARPASSILSGDFNMRADDPILAGLGENYVDAWRAAHPGRPHPPSFGVFDSQFASAPYCCDFVFVTPDLAPRLASVTIVPDTQASDHQPVIVELR